MYVSTKIKEVPISFTVFMTTAAFTTWNLAHFKPNRQREKSMSVHRCRRLFAECCFSSQFGRGSATRQESPNNPAMAARREQKGG